MRTSNALSHTACCAATFYFFSSILHISSSTFPLLIPIIVNLGLLVSLGLRQVSPDLKDSILGYIADCLGMQYNRTNIEVTLPLVEPRELDRQR
jgi:ABC-type Fe3+ transport system permease subunit